MIDDIAIDLWFFENFASIENIRRKCNIMVDLSKFTSNKKNIKWSCSLKLQQSLLSNFVLYQRRPAIPSNSCLFKQRLKVS